MGVHTCSRTLPLPPPRLKPMPYTLPPLQTRSQVSLDHQRETGGVPHLGPHFGPPDSSAAGLGHPSLADQGVTWQDASASEQQKGLSPRAVRGNQVLPATAEEKRKELQRISTLNMLAEEDGWEREGRAQGDRGVQGREPLGELRGMGGFRGEESMLSGFRV